MAQTNTSERIRPRAAPTEAKPRAPNASNPAVDLSDFTTSDSLFPAMSLPFLGSSQASSSMHKIARCPRRILNSEPSF